MPKFQMTYHMTDIYWIQVEAADEEEAEGIAQQLIYDGKVESDWSEEHCRDIERIPESSWVYNSKKPRPAAT